MEEEDPQRPRVEEPFIRSVPSDQAIRRDMELLFGSDANEPIIENQPKTLSLHNNFEFEDPKKSEELSERTDSEICDPE